LAGLNSKNEIAVYCKQDSINTGSLLTIRDGDWNLKRRIGVYHDKSRSTLTAENVLFAIDGADNFIGGNVYTPVIRKYSRDGKLLTAITFETPFNIPVKIALNAQADEIQKIGEFEEQTVRETVEGNSAGIQVGNEKAKPKPVVCNVIAADSKNRIYVITRKRHLTEKESNGMMTISTPKKIIRKNLDFDVIKDIDVNQLLVFNPDGKIIAKVQLSTLLGKIQIHGDRLFIVDGRYNQQILEYQMTFKNENRRPNEYP